MSLAAIGIACKNLKESIKFYSMFDLNFKELGDGHFEATLNPHTRLMLDSHELLLKLNPNWKPKDSSSITLCFEEEQVEFVDQRFSKLIESGYRAIKSPHDAFWRQRYCSVLDPDGNQIDIFCELTA